ncbi:MAG TPA: sigma-54 dependent transcriptional regulator [Polyangiaceae bacterium]
MSHVLVVDDDSTVGLVLEAELQKRGYRVSVCTSAEEARAAAARESLDVVVTDFLLQGVSGTALCKQLLDVQPEVPILVMTAFGSMESAVEAIRAGAYDYVTKPIDGTDLALTIERALKERTLRSEARRLRGLVAQGGSGEMIGSSTEMKQVLELVDRVAQSEVTALVCGETGTGKELVARAIHARGARAAGPFVAINCAAVPETLLESELFGHTKGAFTDARQSKVGLFVKASGGTLFLDEIGEMPAGMQAKLLRALQERVVRPVGSDAEMPFDARIVTATNVDLEKAVAEKRFREDLFYRINVVRIALPPLRNRGPDILEIAAATLRECQPVNRKILGFAPAAIGRLLSYAWPGNIRELQNAVRCAAAVTEFDHIGVDDLPEGIRTYSAPPAEEPTGAMLDQELVPVSVLEQRYIAQVLRAVGGNKTLAAKVLGFDRRTLYRKLEPKEPKSEAAEGEPIEPEPPVDDASAENATHAA